MAPTSKPDVLIIGMGAAGGIAAYVLAKAGLKVVGIEAGPRLSANDFIKRLDELGESGVQRNSLGAPKYNKEYPTWRPNAKSPTVPAPPAVLGMANCVGGSSVHYGCISWRFHEDDFRVRSATVDRYGKSALPAGTSIIDWPLTYKDLEPYYDKVEYLIGVSGKAGNINGKIQPGGNPFEAPRSRDYPMPPLRTQDYLTKVAKAMRQLGYHPYTDPAAITSVNYDGRPPCTFCGFCGNGFGCWNNSRSSTLVTSIADAEKTGNLDILTNTRVMSILSDAKGRVTGVKYRATDGRGGTHELAARFVILSSFVYENNRLLLLSTSPRYPHGLSNNHGQVGKYYMVQNGVGPAVNGLYPQERLNLWGGTSGQSVAMDDLYGDEFDHHGLGFIRGGSLLALTNNQPLGQTATVPPDVPLWGTEYKRWIHENINSVGSVSANAEMLPYKANFIDLDPHTKDELGVPVVRLTFNLYKNEYRMAAYMTKKLTAILKASGATKIWGGQVGPVPVNAHAYGGTRMGDDPASSVVNQFGLSHEAPGLAVMGGSTFTTISGFVPTETIQALAYWGADHIAKNFDTLAV
jgi:gluconate 2-dehydrogenase alpha chain